MDKIDQYIEVLKKISSDDLINLPVREKIILIQHWKSSIAFLEHTLGGNDEA